MFSTVLTPLGFSQRKYNTIQHYSSSSSSEVDMRSPWRIPTPVCNLPIFKLNEWISARSEAISDCMLASLSPKFSGAVLIYNKNE
jgi:hypothetical protein